jgi:hypothetical protein
MLEQSSYFDLGERLRTENVINYFNMSKTLLPKKTDLSYFNWTSGASFHNDSKMFKVEIDLASQEMFFLNKKDKREIHVD